MSDLFPADRLCMLCSYRSIEYNRFGIVQNGEINAKTHQTTNSGLICTKCNGFVCRKCIASLHPVMMKDSKHFLSTTLVEHYSNLLSVPEGTSAISPLNYIGHCCIVGCGQQVLECDADTPASLSGETARLSGCVYFPEFDLFIDSTFDNVDVHILGAEYSSSPLSKKRSIDRLLEGDGFSNISSKGRWHCVIPHEYACKIRNEAPIANGSNPTDWKVTTFRKIRIKCPHMSDKYKEYKVSLYCLHLNFFFLFFSLIKLSKTFLFDQLFGRHTL